MALRSTYDTGLYSSGLYGEPETTQGAATVSCSVSASASAVTVVSAAATASAVFTSSSPAGVIVKDGAVVANVLTLVTAAAIEYVRNDGFRPGYGLNTYGSYIYGENHSVEDGIVADGFAVSVSITPQITRNVSSASQITFSPSVDGYLAQVGASTTDVSFTPNIAYNRIRNCSASDSILGETTVVARYKWLPTSDPTTTWTTSDYLERAA